MIDYIERYADFPVEQFVISCRPKEMKVIDDRYNYYYFRFDGYLWKKLNFKEEELKSFTNKVLNKEKPDIFIIHCLVHSAPAAVFAKKILDRPMIVFLWNNMDYEKYRDICPVYTKRCVEMADYIYGNEVMIERSARFYGISKNKYKVWKPMVDSSIFYRKKVEENVRPVVSFVRGPDDKYGAKEFLEALPFVINKFPTLRINFLIGHDNPINKPKFEKIKELSQTLGIADTVEFIERQLSSEEMADLYNRSNITVSLNLDASLSYSAIEAMRCGSIVLLTVSPEMQFFMKDKKNALLTKHSSRSIGKKLIYGLSHRGLDEEMFKANKKKISEWTVEGFIPKILQVLKKLTNN